MLAVVPTTGVVTAASASVRYPVAFEECSPGLVTDVYESFRLQMNLKEKPDAPLVFEAEHASKIDLYGAERLAFMEDAAGGVAVRQAMGIGFNFETAYLMPNIRARLVRFIGLLDDHTPPFAAATVFHHIPTTIRERKLIVDPWAAHHGRSDLETYIPRWAEEDRKK